MFPSRWSGEFVAFLMVVIALASGCGGGGETGPPRATISGKITLDGKPIGGGEIRFVPTKGSETVARISADGSYSIDMLTDGPVIGQNKVFIEWFRDSGKKDGDGNMISEAAIPEKYNSKSTLSFEVKSGKNLGDFALESK